jgi:hypothetical protein
MQLADQTERHHEQETVMLARCSIMLAELGALERRLREMVISVAAGHANAAPAGLNAGLELEGLSDVERVSAASGNAGCPVVANTSRYNSPDRSEGAG